MVCKTYGETVVVRLQKGEDVVEGLLAACNQENVTLASVTGIGAVGRTVMGFYDISRQQYCAKEYCGEYEITSLVGNVTLLNGEPSLHLHMTIAGEDGVVYGGHLTEAVISLTGEIFLHKIPGIVEKKIDSALGLNLMDLK